MAMKQVDDEQKATLAQEIEALVSRSDNWDVGSLRAMINVIVRRHAVSDGEDQIQPAQVWQNYRPKMTKIRAMRHPDKDAYITISENGDVAVITADKFDVVFEVSEP